MNEKQVAKQEIKPWIKNFARFGYMSKGVVYILIGVLSLLAAIGAGGKTTDSTGALESVGSKPYGDILLWIIALGLTGYVVWKIIQAVNDPENNSNENKSLIRRVFYIITAVIYSFLTYKAITIAIKDSSSNGGNSQQTISSWLLGQAFGQWIIGAIGIIIIGYGVVELYNGWKEKFTKHFQRSKMNDKEYELGKKAGKLGLIARGIVLGIIGIFFIQTAITAQPEKTKGLDGALSEIASQSYGQILLALVAIGLTLYGVFQIIKGKNRNMVL